METLMSDDLSARLGLPYLAAGQLQKHVTLNEALTRLDALVQAAAVSRTVTTQPATPDDGALYILPPGATGSAWSSLPSGALARAEAGGWTVVPVTDGALVAVLDQAEIVCRRDGAWVPLGQNLSRLGVNTEADDANPVAIKVNKALLTALGLGEGGDGDLRVTLNKEAAGDVLSLLFQSGWGGRAEIGLIGGDDLTVKVSADGGTWREALTIDRTTGRTWFAGGAMRTQTTVFEADGDYAPPAWARVVTARLVGGGGGGGSGAVGASGARSGGAGGGSGGLAEACWPVEALDGGLSVIVGAGGTGGAARTTGSGALGADGQFSRVTDLHGALLTAFGGKGGRGGDATGGLGGAGGHDGNAGGAARPTEAGGAGEAMTGPGGPGGGGGGGAWGATALSGGAGGGGGAGRAPTIGGAAGVSAAGGPGGGVIDPQRGGAGAGGGGGSAGAAGFAGGAGGLVGGGGGGGGAGVTTSGAGGSGARGVVVLTAIG